VPVPANVPHEVLVRVRNVGLCSTDLKIRAGRMGLNVLPLIMGREVAGEVAEVGSQVQEVQPGERVTVNFYVTCGRLVRNEWEILGSHANTKQELQETMELVAQRHSQPMVDRVFPFTEVEAAFEVLRQGRSLGRNVLAI
jgi:D-arabinose 1-dehydrogenase-like Zn-dependent alcohol dehydrogenase